MEAINKCKLDLVVGIGTYVKQIIPSSTFYIANSVLELQQKIWRDSERQIYKRAWAPLGSCNIYGFAAASIAAAKPLLKIQHVSAA